MSKPMDDAQTDAPTLLPCPFCQEDSAQMYGGLGAYCIRCDTCGTDGPRGLRREDAITKWNRRTPILSAALASPRATGSTEKPVAWRYRWRNTTPSGDADAWSYTDTQPAPDSAMLGVLRKDIEPLYDHPSPSLASATAGEPTNFNSGERRPWDGAQLDASEAVVCEAMREYKNCALQDGHTFGPDAKETLRRICNVALAKWREEWYESAASPPVPESPSPPERAARLCDSEAAIERIKEQETAYEEKWRHNGRAELAEELARNIRALGASPSPVPEQTPE